MLTYVPRTRSDRDGRPSYRPFRAEVVRIVELSPCFRRVTFTGPDFGDFGTAGLDQRIKLVLPNADGGIGDCGWDDPAVLADGSWYERWRTLPEEARNPIRTYTVRAIRPGERELDVDFVVHTKAGHPGADGPGADGPGAERPAADGPGTASVDGPAAVWLAGARAGDELIIVGPDDRSSDYDLGLDWRPGEAIDYLLAGDETAAPAICAILESLPAGTRAHAFIEVPCSADAQPVQTAAEGSITWLARDEGGVLQDAVRGWLDTHREAIAPALASDVQELADIDVDVDMLWDSPVDVHGRFYAWLAGESAAIKSLRRLLVSEVGVDRRKVAFMGYWRRGKAEGS
ncbi:siderophore-interacting protein [Herbiconiux sp. CPCC 205716]|uniref:Siderophore-interacting protein n=1 Tax=Herbiconiux gentiana TaxID=2970912 RepID=A0ABT2GIH2_9MICO|nr:siderophore-interacting protein [Herbiconiux gentiana]MCS5716022.1 siderophore-interacting protein [Herbiconiux gentiana]